MSSKSVQIFWTKTGDARRHERAKLFTIELPVSKQLSDIEEKIMGFNFDLVYTQRDCANIRLPDTYDAEPTDAELVGYAEAVIDRLAALKKAEEEKEKAEKEKIRQKKNKSLEKWLAEPNFAAEILERERFTTNPKITLPYTLRDEYNLCDKNLIDKVKALLRVENIKLIDCWLDSPKLQKEFPVQISGGRYKVYYPIYTDYREKVADALERLIEEQVSQEREQKLVDEKKKEQDSEERLKLIKKWASKHGSVRLNKQIKQGYSGWPLYLHEKVRHDFAKIDLRAKLNADAIDHDEICNPREEYLDCADRVAGLLVSLGLEETKDDAFEKISIRKSEDHESTRYTYLVIDYYSPDQWFKDREKTYTIQIEIDSEDLNEYDYE